MTLVDILLKVIQEEIPNILDEKPNLRANLEKAVFDNRFRIIRNDEDREIGFLTWEEDIQNGKLCITIGNLVILKEHKGEFNLCKLRRWFREIYPRAVFNWKSRKRGGLVCVS